MENYEIDKLAKALGVSADELLKYYEIPKKFY